MRQNAFVVTALHQISRFGEGRGIGKGGIGSGNGKGLGRERERKEKERKGREVEKGIGEMGNGN